MGQTIAVSGPQQGETVIMAPKDPLRAIVSMLNALGIPMILYDRDARLVHETARATTLLGADVEEDRLRAAARRMAVAACRTSEHQHAPFATEIATLIARYEFRAARFAADTAGWSAAVAIAARTVSGLGDGDLAHRGLTPRETEVARLMGRGLSNEAVGRSLGISHHTAERHAERVLRKLRLNSRAALAALLHAPRD